MIAPQAAPQPKFNELIDELNRLWNCFDLDPYSLRIKQIKAEIERAKSNFPDEAYTALGIIACVEEKFDDMRKYHENAIKISGDNFHVIFQYAMSLAKAGMLEEGYDMGLKAYEIDDSDSGLLQFLIDNSFRLFKEEDYAFYRKKLIDMKADFLDPNEFYLDNDEIIGQIAEDTEKLLTNHPETVKEPDPELMKEIEDLIDGVDLS